MSILKCWPLMGFVLFTGCAGLDVAPIRSDQDEIASRGFRYYELAPFLFVHSDGKGGLSTQIVYLPDTTRKMSAHPYDFLASNETTLTFDRGTLTSAVTVADETAVPSAFVDAISKAAQAAIKAGALNNPAGTQATVPVPYLFKIVIFKDHVELRGGPFEGAALDPTGKEKMTINVTLSAQGGN